MKVNMPYLDPIGNAPKVQIRNSTPTEKQMNVPWSEGHFKGQDRLPTTIFEWTCYFSGGGGMFFFANYLGVLAKTTVEERPARNPMVDFLKHETKTVKIKNIRKQWNIPCCLFCCFVTPVVFWVKIALRQTIQTCDRMLVELGKK